MAEGAGSGPPGPGAAPLRPVVPSSGDLAATYLEPRRTPPPGRPWVTVSMVTSVDGAVAVDGRSGPLGGEPDRAVFRTLRQLPDVILVGAGTARAERYGPPTVDPSVQEARRRRGQSPVPRLAVVTRRLALDPTAAMFRDADQPPVVFAAGGGDPSHRGALEAVAHLVDLPDRDGGVEMAAALRLLGELGARHVLAEGGPTLNGALVAADLVDEWCVTIDPSVVGGEDGRMIAGAPAGQRPLRLASALDAGGALLLRYLRIR